MSATFRYTRMSGTLLRRLASSARVWSSNPFACTVFVGSARLAERIGGISVQVRGLPLGATCPTGSVQDSPVPCGYNQLYEGDYQVDFVQKPMFDPTTLPDHHECMTDNPNVRIGTITIVGGSGSAAVTLPPDVQPGDRSTICVASPYTLTGNEVLVVIV